MPKRPPRKREEISVPRDLRAPQPDGRTALQTERGQLIWADAIEFLSSLDGDSVDLVVADPPYAVDKDEWDRFDSLDAYLDWTEQWAQHVARILRPGGSAYVFGYSEILADIKARIAKRFASCRWLVWFYRNKANLGRDWGRSHESILHLRTTPSLTLNVDDVRVPYNNHTKRYPGRTQAESSQYGGKRTEKWQPHPLGAKPRDVLEIPVLCNGMDERTQHPTQKPEELIRRLVAGTSNPGDTIVDPFVGSGTTAVIAERLGRSWHCADADPRYLGIARRRVEQEVR